MTCIILEDDPLAREVIKELVLQADELELKSEFQTADEALAFLKKDPVDLVLMDVELPEVSGFDFLRKLKKRPLIIIISGHEKYAHFGFEFNVADYLVKPVQPERFEQAINKALALQDARSREWKIQNKDFIFIKDGNILQKINFQDIQWLEAQGDYVKVVTQQKQFMVHTTLKSIEDKLPEQTFVKVHRSFIISITHIDKIEENIIYIRNKSIPVSDTYWKPLKEKLNIL